MCQFASGSQGPPAIREDFLSKSSWSKKVVLRWRPSLLTSLPEQWSQQWWLVDCDGDGVQRRIFLDLVALLRDNPAINSVLDVLRHTASSCCHLCSFRRQPDTIIGSHYTGIRSKSMHSAHRRDLFLLIATRDDEASMDSCKLLGIRFKPDKIDLLLHQILYALSTKSSKITMTEQGAPVVPHISDPQRACLVAPDHLLTGHFKDCFKIWHAGCFRRVSAGIQQKTT